jgi:phosphinothricin acetyltransferase
LHEQVSVRSGRDSDVPAINGIYNYYVEHTTVTFDVEPWSPEKRRFWFRQFAPDSRHQIVVAERDGEVAGFAYSTTFRSRTAYDKTVETTVYVHRDARRHGIGTALYTELFDRLAKQDVHRAVACIALPNDPSIALHEDLDLRPRASSKKSATNSTSSGTSAGTPNPCHNPRPLSVKRVPRLSAA